jgi:hypothetical protein
LRLRILAYRLRALRTSGEIDDRLVRQIFVYAMKRLRHAQVQQMHSNLVGSLSMGLRARYRAARAYSQRDRRAHGGSRFF